MDIIAKLIENSLLDRKKLFEYTAKKGKIYLDTLLEENLLEKGKFFDFLIALVKSGQMQLKDIEKLELDDEYITEFFKYLANKFSLEFVDISALDVDISLVAKIPISILLKNKALPITEDDMYITAVFADPFDIAAQDTILRYYPSKLLKVAITIPSYLEDKLLQIETYNSLKSYVEEIKEDLKTSASVEDDNESPAVLKLIELILKASIVRRASDIHIEATEKNTTVRARIDGMLQQIFIFEKEVFGPLASRIKLLSNLDIAEKRKPQDGRFTSKVSGKEYDFRVSTLPTLIGESIVLRILDKSKALITLEEMGMNEINYNRFKNAIHVPYGIVLVTGPTGSGKTTTLYGALNAIKTTKDKIITVEDPVEYQMSGIAQVQVNPQAGLTFASALRSILRQDPDKIMIGEIRDNETLRIAIQAAMTGHLVLSTLHTNDAISAVHRMIDMGIESYLVSGSLVAVQAQRLVRRICPSCKIETTITGAIYEEIKQYIPEGKEVKFFKGEGCRNCNNTGYVGREMISEVLSVSTKISRMIAADASKEEIEKQAYSEGFVTMFEDGILKALDGKTTVDEIYRVARL